MNLRKYSHTKYSEHRAKKKTCWNIKKKSHNFAQFTWRMAWHGMAWKPKLQIQASKLCKNEWNMFITFWWIRCFLAARKYYCFHLLVINWQTLPATTNSLSDEEKFGQINQQSLKAAKGYSGIFPVNTSSLGR